MGVFFSTTLVSYSPPGDILMLGFDTSRCNRVRNLRDGVRKDNVAHRIELMQFK
jgi:hypothetical protein